MGDYSVATKNRFQLSMLENSDDEDVDLYEILKHEEESKTQQKKKAIETVAVGPKKNAKSKNEKNSKPNQEQAVVKAGVNDVNAVNIQKSGNSRFAKSGGGGGGENRPAGTRQNERRNKDFEQPPSEQGGGNSRFGRGGGSAYRGGRGGRGGKRFDRHSGSDKTGVKPTEKREGFGGHNWGGEIQSQLASTTQSDEAGEQANVDEITNKEDKGDTEPDVEVEAEPEVKEMTLDEWKAAQVNNRSKQQQQFNVRRAGEGEDQSQWKSTVALESSKRTQQSQDETYEEEQDDELKVEATRSALDKLNIKIEFASEGRPRGGGPSVGRGRYNSGPRNDRRGGARGGRGRGGRGGFQGGFRNNRFSDRNAAPRVDNEKEFPSLGSK